MLIRNVSLIEHTKSKLLRGSTCKVDYIGMLRILKHLSEYFKCRFKIECIFNTLNKSATLLHP
jgi:hypothetical protein